uniref:Uncharacterized protein n=1 Tax=Corvus moneduloides TaxID=1196302 RepID=A0A8C3ENQ1_CORMO
TTQPCLCPTGPVHRQPRPCDAVRHLLQHSWSYQLFQEGFGQVVRNFGPVWGKQRWSCCEQPAGCSAPGEGGAKPLAGVQPGTKALLQ